MSASAAEYVRSMIENITADGREMSFITGYVAAHADLVNAGVIHKISIEEVVEFARAAWACLDKQAKGENDGGTEGAREGNAAG